MKNFAGHILMFVAVGLLIPMTIINRKNVEEKYGTTDGYYKNTAVNIDIFANREFRATWNKWLKIEGGYEFGRQGETISSALAKNQLQGTLSKKGILLKNILNAIEKNHCLKWIKYFDEDERVFYENLKTI